MLSRALDAARFVQASCGHSLPILGTGLAMNECSVWEQSTRWMLFRFGSEHRKHCGADAAPGGLLARFNSWAGLQRPINMDINKGSGMGGGLGRWAAGGPSTLGDKTQMSRNV